MRILDLQNEFRELITSFRGQVEAASAMGSFDIHKVSEDIVCALFRELLGWSKLRNVNTEQANFPSIDLADDSNRVAIQVTATADIEKIKSTLRKFVEHNLHQQYDRLIIYILTTKQKSYSLASLEMIVNKRLKFQPSDDIWDFQNLCTVAANATPQQLQSAVNHLKSYLRGIPLGLADEDIDPPLQPPESLMANLIEIYFPSSLYIAELSTDLIDQHGERKPGLWRETIRKFYIESGSSVPSAYVIHGKNLITFFDLTDENNPYRHLIDLGTAEEHQSYEFSMIDEDYERVFKSLLRFSLQQRLYQERVRWEHFEKEFIFLPRKDGENQREEVWQGEKKAKRTVFIRQFNKKNLTKTDMQKHLSFAVEFLAFDNKWFMSVTPNWFFSYGEDFKKSGYAYKNLSWIKRQENNQQVANHFRFVATWLKSIDEEDLFTEKTVTDSFLSFGQIRSLEGAPLLEESNWKAMPSPNEDEQEQPQAKRLFN